MPLWILFFTALTLALHSVPAEAPEPEPSAPVEVVLTEPVFRAETGLPMYPDYTLDKDLLVWAEEYEASTGTPVVMYDFNTVLEGADQLEAWVTAFEAGEPAPNCSCWVPAMDWPATAIPSCSMTAATAIPVWTPMPVPASPKQRSGKIVWAGRSPELYR